MQVLLFRSVNSYFFSASDSVRDTNPIGRLVPSGSLWDKTVPTPYLDVSQATTNSGLEIRLTFWSAIARTQ